MKYIFLIILFCLPTLSFGQEKLIITGNVSSEMDGEIIGAHVLEVDKNDRTISATVTDYSGNFSLDIKNPNNNLQVRYVGYKKVTLPIGSKRVFNINMESSTELTEVVVKGKAMHSDGTFAIPQREISGAVQKINTKEFQGLSVASIDDALQGRIAGLDIVGNSGNLGSGSTLRIRGTSSINANSQPLIVVNDVPFENNLSTTFDFTTANQEQYANLLSISPDDIEEITVLKDGSSAAIWGSRGANGVISIKTKRGAKGPTKVQYSYRFSGKRQPKGIEMLNGDDYTMMMKQAYFNPRQDENAVNGRPEYNYVPTFSAYEQFNNNTDWVDAVSQYGITNDQNLTVSGGGEKARFRISLGYFDETGVVIEQRLKRYTTRMSLDYYVSTRIKFGSEFAVTYIDNNKNYARDGSDTYNTENLLTMAYKKMPNVSIYEQDAYGNDTKFFYAIPQRYPDINPRTGSFYEELPSSQKDLLNPVALAKLATNDEKKVSIEPTLSLQYDILDPNESLLRYKGYVAFKIENQDLYRFLPREVTSYDWNHRWVNNAYNRESEAVTVQSDQNLTWTPKLTEQHDLTLYGSWQFSTVNSRDQEFETYGIPSSENMDPTVPGNRIALKNPVEQRRTMAFLARLHYAFKERYILDMSFRRDADSRFGNNNRWGNFPAISGKWIASDETFMESTKSWMSELGFRAGYGVTGNPPNYNYLYFSRYDGRWGDQGGRYIDLSTIKPTSVQLADLRWERISSFNAGIDLSLFDFKYTANFNVYKRKTEDLLYPGQSIPSSSGFGSLAYVNAGRMDNTGWELYLSTNKMLKFNDWTIDVNLNLSNQVNKIISLSESYLNSYNKEFNYRNGPDSYMSRIQEGNALGSIYGFRYKGVYQYDKYDPDFSGTSPYARDPSGNVILDNNGNPVPMYFGYGTGTPNYRFRGGDAIYEDINHDGTIDELDIVYLGNSNPKVSGGFGATVRYKNFTMNAFFVFRSGGKILNRARMEAEGMYNNNNQSIAVNWRWRKEGDLREIPRALYDFGGTTYNSLASDRYVEDGSFLRFKYLTFIYDFDREMLKPLKLSQLNLSLSLNNLLTFTKYTGVDPEISPNMNPNDGLLGVSTDKNSTPRAQYFTLGVTVGF